MNSRFHKILLALLIFMLIFSGCQQRDNNPPQVSITNPENQAIVSGILTIQVQANDNVGVVKVEFYVDGVKIGEDTSSPYTCDWNTDNLNYGSQHTIQAKAYDKAGNVGESSVINVTIGDTQAPQVTITNPTNGQTVSGTITIQVNVVENVSVNKKLVNKAQSGIKKVEFYVDEVKIGEDTGSPYTWNWDTTTVSNGNHTIMVKAYDNAENVGIASITINVNNIPGPTYVESVAITYPEGSLVSSKSKITSKVIDKITKNSKIHPKLVPAIKSLCKGVKERTNVKNFIPLKISKVNVLPKEYHIFFEVWWSSVPNATSYNVYLSKDFVNYTLIANTGYTDIYWYYADEDLGLEPEITYRVMVKAVVNGKETLGTVGSWDITVLGNINLVSPANRELNVPTSPLIFEWQNAVGNPYAWNIVVFNSWDMSGWDYYEEGTLKDSISYNYDGTAPPLYPGAIYRWFIYNYRDRKYSNINEYSYYFSISFSIFQLFQTNANDFVKLKWQDTNKDMDLLVEEPDGKLYSPWLEGYNTPNGFFLGDEPDDHGFDFEQYSWKDIGSADYGTYTFYGFSWGENETVQVEYNIYGIYNIYETLLQSGNTPILLEVNIQPNSSPKIKFLTGDKIPPHIREKIIKEKVKTKK